MKRIFSAILALVMIFTLSCTGAASAKEAAPRASLTLSKYTVILGAGKSGEIMLTYSVTATGTANYVGVSAIKIYKADGSHVATIAATGSNGLYGTSRIMYGNEYIYAGTSGTSYYMEVTVFATIGNTSDSRVVTTATVKAP